MIILRVKERNITMTDEERKLKNKKYYEKNKEKILAQKRKYHSKNQENIKKRKKKYYEKNKKEILDNKKNITQIIKIFF